MSAFTSPTVVAQNDVGHLKIRVMTIVGTASYDAGGSTVDLSVATLGTSVGFNTVFGVSPLGAAASTSGTYKLTFLPAASYASATGKIYVTHVEQATPAEASGNLSTSTFTVLVVGA
jgi:hypothetical protein